MENCGEVVMVRPAKSLYHFCLEASHMVTPSLMGGRKRTVLDIMKRIIIQNNNNNSNYNSYWFLRIPFAGQGI